MYSQQDKYIPAEIEIRKINHKETLRMIGEIEGITLRSINLHTVGVFLHIGGEEIEVMRDSGVNIEHSITREGLRELIS